MALVVILAITWLAILGPGIVRRRSQFSDGTGSIAHFHRQLRVLRRSSPAPIVRPAFRLRSVQGEGLPGGPDADAGAVPVLTVVGADRLPRPALAFLGERTAAPGGRSFEGDRFDAPGPSHAGTGNRPSSFRPLTPSVRQLNCKRRRDTLAVLAMVFVGTLLVGGIPGAHALWVLTAFSAVVLAGYVTLLVHLRNMAAERQHKLRYLEPRHAGRAYDAQPDDASYGRPAARAAAR